MISISVRTPLMPLFRTEDGRVQIVHSCRGVGLECNLGRLHYSSPEFKLLREFRRNPPIKGATNGAHIDDVAVILPRETSRRMSGIADVTRGLQEHLRRKEVALNRLRSRVLLPGGFGTK